MTFGEIYVQAVGNGKRVAMSRRVLMGDTFRARQELYRVLHEGRSMGNMPDDIQWRAATYNAGFQHGWDLGWAAAGKILQAHNGGQPIGVLGVPL